MCSGAFLCHRFDRNAGEGTDRMFVSEPAHTHFVLRPTEMSAGTGKLTVSC
jgi:hypothetical protein